MFFRAFTPDLRQIPLDALRCNRFWCLEPEIETLHFHDTRHEAITRLARAGRLSVLQLARMVGHRDLRSLQIYYNETATELAALLD